LFKSLKNLNYGECLRCVRALLVTKTEGVRASTKLENYCTVYCTSLKAILSPFSERTGKNCARNIEKHEEELFLYILILLKYVGKAI
jgi:hypothetical protein